MILVLGAGVAGLMAAHAACAAGADVTLVSAGTLALGDACSTAMAQGGIAAAIGPGDTPLAHLADTVSAGAGLVDIDAARVLVEEGASDVQRVLAAGFEPDRSLAGDVALGLEGAHGAHRIVHAGGDRTGVALQTHLVAQLPQAVRVIERAELDRLLVDEGVDAESDSGTGAVVGAVLVHENGESETVHASAVVMATGGYAALYDRTSNHAGARGAGISAAAEAGALLADLEFVQFHPTVLAGTGQLISEAVRGAGAVLLNAAGNRFMVGKDPAAELASRDVVSREIHRELRDTGEPAVWLDASHIERTHGTGSLAQLFPGIDAATRAHGFCWATDPVPVTPAAHYAMGGVATDLHGRSSISGLFVAGEAAATGVHGANRLASNSLLEGLVFGRRAGEAAAAHVPGQRWQFSGAAMPRLLGEAVPLQVPVPVLVRTSPPVAERAATAQHVSRILGAQLGIERDAQGLTAALTELETMAGRDAYLATLMAHAALARRESRGGHQRADYPTPDPACAKRSGFRVQPTPQTYASTSTCDLRPVKRMRDHAARDHPQVHTDPIADVRRSPVPC